MSVYGDWKAATISAGASSSSEVNLGKDYDLLEIQIPSMDRCKLYLQVAELTSGDFYDIGDKDFINSQKEEVFGYADVWKLGGYQFIKVVATKGQTAERLIRVRGMRY